MSPPFDEALLDDLLAGTQRKRWPPSDGALLEVGDPEVQFALALREGEPSVEKISRGVRRTVARFSDQSAAYRLLVLLLAEDRRADRGWPPIDHERLAPSAELTDGPEGQRLTWPGGWAVFPPGRFGKLAALSFSWAAQVAPAEIVQSYGNLNGEPLFDLGIADSAKGNRPARSTLRSRPPETPPPDSSADSEIAAVLATAAEIGWYRLPDAEGDVLTVGHEDTGRIVGFRHGMFEYRSFAGAHCTIRATASTAAAARRLLVMEAAAIARTRRRQQPIQLRVRGPAAGFTVTKGPTEFVAEGDGVRATFPLGPVAEQQALLFTHAANATVDDIVASFQDPTGAPLLAARR